MVIPREARIKHDTKILELVNPTQGLITRRNTKVGNSGELLLLSYKHYLSFRVVRKKKIILKPGNNGVKVFR